MLRSYRSVEVAGRARRAAIERAAFVDLRMRIAKRSIVAFDMYMVRLHQQRSTIKDQGIALGIFRVVVVASCGVNRRYHRLCVVRT